MTKDYTYNGHKNYSCWNVSLYIDNEYELYKELQRLLNAKVWTGGYKYSKDHIAEIFQPFMVRYLATCRTYSSCKFDVGYTPDNVKITVYRIRQHLVGIERGNY